jgi:hypothetical protein
MHGVTCLVIQQCIRSQLCAAHLASPQLNARHKLPCNALASIGGPYIQPSRKATGEE